MKTRTIDEWYEVARRMEAHTHHAMTGPLDADYMRTTRDQIAAPVRQLRASVEEAAYFRDHPSVDEVQRLTLQTAREARQVRRAVFALITLHRNQPRQPFTRSPLEQYQKTAAYRCAAASDLTRRYPLPANMTARCLAVMEEARRDMDALNQGDLNATIRASTLSVTMNSQLRTLSSAAARYVLKTEHQAAYKPGDVFIVQVSPDRYLIQGRTADKKPGTRYGTLDEATAAYAEWTTYHDSRPEVDT